MDLSVIIVSFNVASYLRKCLASLQKLKIEHEVIVVDNGSQDATCDTVEKNFPKVKLIKNQKNQGFGSANNLGAAKARGKFLFFLNPDTRIKKNCLEKMVEYFNKNPQIGAIGPKLILETGEIQKDSSGFEPNLINLLLIKLDRGLRFLTKRKSPYFGSIDYYASKKQSVDWVSGAALLIRKKFFDRVNGFDSKFFMYFEDVDLCLRLKKMGLKITYFPKAEIIHFGGKSLKKNQKRKKIYYNSQDYFYLKHYGRFKLFLLKILRFPSELKK